MKKSDRRSGRLFGTVQVRLEARKIREEQYLPALQHHRKAESLRCKEKTIVGKSGETMRGRIVGETSGTTLSTIRSETNSNDFGGFWN